MGNTGLHSDYVRHYLEYLAENAGISYKDMIQNALCLSSDVSAAFDPTFPDVYEPGNSCYLGKGCVLTKYTGARGKSGSSDASAETMSKASWKPTTFTGRPANWAKSMKAAAVLLHSSSQV